ncbi:signal peptidase I [Clostridium cochlearium]|uniref:Signal peptidase I n=1 Tax=Clostridium cochlearium TaxID=1494 RepID=A0ABY0QJU5_CLOCO|nr:signal peptidase I [Clostridium cochlearium]MBV1820235.1 signal peptidase I [Bacteroidales bacterium MSK.15.36]NSJ90060.1 signal peptidase I [Coprococcus sp. MSK.21.13]MCG4572597.1 signal peptidase I [Clostridium cochlearium]MCG4578981.1 signal peptidase I [Clostridium cochlearium]NME95021.1 signal peptidase I [Clostridium cochlearium]
MVKELIELGKSILIAIIAAFFIITFIFETVSVDGHSMYPTLNDKDRLIVEKVTYYFRKPKKGDIVVIKYPKNPKEKFIKRVIATGGDKIRIENDTVYVNDEAKNEDFIFEHKMEDFPEVTIPEGTIFVMGDNRNNSLDSRDERVGFVKLNMVVGKATLRIYPFKKWGILSAITN